MQTTHGVQSQKKTVWLIEAYDQWFSRSSCNPFCICSSRESAIKTIYECYSKEAIGQDAELYENGTNQWKSDVLSCGIMIREVELDKPEELR